MTQRPRLAEQAQDAIKQADGNRVKACERFLQTVLNDAALLVELMGAKAIQQRADSYVNAFAPATEQNNGSGASRRDRASQDVLDRPASTPHHSMTRTGAMTVAKKSIFNKRIVSHLDVCWRDLTPRQIYNLAIHNAYTRAIEEKCRPFIRRASDLDAPATEWLTESECEEIQQAADAAQAAALHAVKALTYAN